MQTMCLLWLDETKNEIYFLPSYCHFTSIIIIIINCLIKQICRLQFFFSAPLGVPASPTGNWWRQCWYSQLVIKKHFIRGHTIFGHSCHGHDLSLSFFALWFASFLPPLLSSQCANQINYEFMSLPFHHHHHQVESVPRRSRCTHVRAIDCWHHNQHHRWCYLYQWSVSPRNSLIADFY